MNRLTLLLMLALLPWAASAEQTDETHGGLRFDVEWMHPMRGASSSVPWGYYVELNLDSAWVCLPYRGEAHEPTTDDDGLNFGRPVAVKDLRRSAADATWRGTRSASGSSPRGRLASTCGHSMPTPSASTPDTRNLDSCASAYKIER